jgi:hypothetical protein
VNWVFLNGDFFAVLIRTERQRTMMMIVMMRQHRIPKSFHYLFSLHSFSQSIGIHHGSLDFHVGACTCFSRTHTQRHYFSWTINASLQVLKKRTSHRVKGIIIIVVTTSIGVSREIKMDTVAPRWRCNHPSSSEINNK